MSFCAKRTFGKPGYVQRGEPKNTCMTSDGRYNLFSEEDLERFCILSHSYTPVSKVYRFAQMIVDSCVHLSILAIPIHPHDDYTMNGVQTRALAPTAFVLIQVKSRFQKPKKSCFEQRIMNKMEIMMNDLFSPFQIHCAHTIQKSNLLRCGGETM